ncbi:hypothetical protein [Paraliomyxa miuraensis]|uniref:hypothetical protein n=1 Tax=Paraliomyxa miuraensis TaxID=376150 RepID=UPI002258201F|nr:hypothetical protein [Paraliomyxa miuraensis]MCX4247673.1 hypothetical protein [Paraliomyxa miuraensis]
MTMPGGPDAERLRGLLDELGDVIEGLLRGGMTTASKATRDKLDVTFREVSRQGLLRLAASLSNVSREIGRYVAQDAQFSARRLSLFIGRTWLLARGMARALRDGDATTFERLAIDRRSEPVSELRAVTLGVHKKVVPGAFCGFDFRMRRLDGDKLGDSLAFTEMFPMKASGAAGDRHGGPPKGSGQDIPAEAYLVIDRPQRYKPRILLDGGVITFRNVMVHHSDSGQRLALGKDSRVEAAAPFTDWGSVPGWTPADALARVRAHQADPLELPNELQEEVVLDQWELGPATKDEQRHVYPVRSWGLALDGVVADGVEGKALRENLERLRKGQGPVGLGPGMASIKAKVGAKRLFGLLHYETCRFVLQPLALLGPSGPIHLMTSAEGIDHKALLRNLVRR